MQNLISLNLSAQDLTDLDAAIATVRRVFEPLITLQADEVRGLAKMGEKSETFCRQTLNVLAANPQIVPPSLSLAEAQADLDALDALRPRLLQLRQLPSGTPWLNEAVRLVSDHLDTLGSRDYNALIRKMKCGLRT